MQNILCHGFVCSSVYIQGGMQVECRVGQEIAPTEYAEVKLRDW